MVSLKKLALWRKQLTIELARHHPDLSSEQLSVTVNQILERLLLYRICEERGIVTDQQLLQLIQQPQIYQKWNQLWANGVGLSGLVFSQVQPDDLAIAISDKLMKSVIQDLYDVEELAATPLEILGQCYEQLLDQNRSSHRKNEGIYYTPSAIVEDIIRNTLGQKLREQTLRAMERSPLRIIDPACGAGSFLGCAYQVLLEWYRNQYVASLSRYQNYLYQNRVGKWTLTIEAKKRILLQHIYGVDIDAKAVELTKQLLLLLMLRDRVEQMQFRQLKKDVSLSLLDLNIYCGDALIGSDFEHSNTIEQHNGFQFDWEINFSQVMQAGGFDVVVGNPPWVFTRDAQFDDRVKQYYQSKYLAELETTQVGKTKQAGKINLFTLFLLLFIRLLHPQGRMGILVPNTLLRTTLYDAVRKYVLDYCRIEQIVDLGGDSFSGVTAALIILILSKENASTHIQIRNGITTNSTFSKTLNQQTFLDNTGYVFSILVNDTQAQLFNRMVSLSIPLQELTQALIEGIVCRRDQILRSQPDRKYQKLLEGKDIQRYSITFRDKYILFDRSQIHRPRPDYIWEAKEKIILRRIGGGKYSLIGALDTENYYTFASTNNLLLRLDCDYDIRYILALINSKLLNYYYSHKFTNCSRLTVNISKTFAQQLPTRKIDFCDKSDRGKYDLLVELVDLIQFLNKQIVSSKIDDQRQMIQAQIEQIDQQIDRTVYALYQLTEAEIEMVETGISD